MQDVIRSSAIWQARRASASAILVFSGCKALTCHDEEVKPRHMRDHKSKTIAGKTGTTKTRTDDVALPASDAGLTVSAQTDLTEDAAPFGTYAPTGFVARAIGWTRRLGLGRMERRIAFALRRAAINALGGSTSTRPVDVETLGARMRLYPYANVCEKRVLFTPQYFDAEERAALASDIATIITNAEHPGRGYNFVDIGANVGAYALFVAAQAGRGAKILAIEPQPDIFARLIANIGMNPSGTIKAVACAVADKAGELTLFIDTRNSGESSVRMLRSSSTRTLKVPAVTLKSLLEAEGYDRLDALKLDVEGAEDLILEPFLRSAPESLWPRMIIIEDSTTKWHVDLIELIHQSGYKQVLRTKLNFVFARP
jgi:FkbM family methyltransferase